MYLTMLAVENDMKVVEVPITFNRLIDKSKLRANEKLRGIKIGLSFLWFVITY
ncbi:protein of unknown function [Candidatus Nitrosotalea okcheonensis]|uniref:Uncharacterized protein n=1 Tax=Candidatus Nitrosotalea okcheonensis TaxID=1903276 RepID=A0A2H1FHR9_9ARCH|nr:protein of unknown function [Candidatus Nitrosotalea okcheonensis]